MGGPGNHAGEKQDFTWGVSVSFRQNWAEAGGV